MSFGRKEISLTMIIIMVISMIIPMSFAQDNNIKEKYQAGVVIVQFEESLKAEEKVKHREELGLSLKKEFKKEGLELLKINGKKTVEDVIEKLSKKKGVAFVEPNYMYYPSEIPNDEYFDLLWGLENSKDFDIDATEAWDIQKGSGVVVAVIDTGVQIAHPDLLGQFVDGYDFYEDNESVYDGPEDDHGTHVAGTIAAIANNNIGVVGVAPEVKIMPLKFLGPDGGYTSDAIDAINFAKDNGADVINASWGGGGESQALKEAIKMFGGPFVAAAGNSRIDTDRFPHYPSSYSYENPADDHIISVAAIDSKGRLARFSNYGDVSVDVGAPGVDIASTYPDGYAYMSGTSMAAPHVTGIAALMLAEDAGLSTNDLINIMFDTSVPLTALNGKTVTGGLVNANLALEALSGTPVNTAPVVTIVEPVDATSVEVGTSLIFTGTALDTEDGELSPQLEWTSNIDGLIGNGTGFEMILSQGTHTITASVTDSGGLASEDVVTVIVESNTPPNSELVYDVSYNYWNHPKKNYGNVEANVSVTDINLGPVVGITVDGHWVYNGINVGDETGITGDGGLITFTKSKVTDPEGYVFIVDTLTP